MQPPLWLLIKEKLEGKTMALSPSSSPPTPETIRSGIFDPLRRLCDSHQFHFVVLLQHSSSKSQRFWTSSKPLRNLFGDLITEIATFVDVFGDGSFPCNIDAQAASREVPDQGQVATDELKMEVEDGESLAAVVAEAALTTATRAAAIAATAPSTVPIDGWSDDPDLDDDDDDDCVLLPMEELEDDTEGREEEEEEEVEEHNGIKYTVVQFGERLNKEHRILMGDGVRDDVEENHDFEDDRAEVVASAAAAASETPASAAAVTATPAPAAAAQMVEDETTLQVPKRKRTRYG